MSFTSYSKYKGRWLDARLCWMDLGQEGEIRRIAEHLPPSLRPDAPPPEAAEEAPTP